MKVSVVISTCNRPKLLNSTITSILNNNYPDFDLIIVDQSDNDQTKNLVKEHKRSTNKIDYIRCFEKGTGKGRNLGINHAKGSIIAVTDDDCVVAKDWVERIVAFFNTYPDAAVIFGDVIPGESSTSGVLCPWYNAANKKYRGVFALIDIVGLGANMAIKKELINKFGVFDENIGAGALIPAAEDCDLAYRVLASGCAIYDTSSVKVWHNGWKDFKGTLATIANYRTGHAAFFSKYLRCGDYRALPIYTILTLKTIYYTLFAGLFRRSNKRPIKLPNSLFAKVYFLIFWLYHPFFDTISGIFKSYQFYIDKNKKVFVKKCQ